MLKFWTKGLSLEINIGADLEDEHMTSEKLYMKTFPVAVVPVLYIIEHVNELD